MARVLMALAAEGLDLQRRHGGQRLRTVKAAMRRDGRSGAGFDPARLSRFRSLLKLALRTAESVQP
jgi:hypothetical protein